MGKSIAALPPMLYKRDGAMVTDTSGVHWYIGRFLNVAGTISPRNVFLDPAIGKRH